MTGTTTPASSSTPRSTTPATTISDFTPDSEQKMDDEDVQHYLGGLVEDLNKSDDACKSPLHRAALDARAAKMFKEKPTDESAHQEGSKSKKA